MLKRRKQDQQGFSLIEIMLAIVLSAVVLAVGASLLALGNQVSARTEALLAANAAAFAKIQEYENKEFDSIPIGDIADDYEVEDFSDDIAATTNNIVKNAVAKVYAKYENETTESLINLRVEIDFQYGSKMRKIEYGTYIQIGGVGR